MHSFTVVFVMALLAHLVVRVWLAWRQVRFVAAHRAAVPAGFASVVSPAEHARAADYAAAGERLDMVDAVYDTPGALALTLGGGIAAAGAWTGTLAGDGVHAGTLHLLAVFAVLAVIGLSLHAAGVPDL